MKRGKDFWGRPYWTMVHILTSVFTQENKEFLVKFFYLLTRLLPCDVCRKNLSSKLNKYPPEKYLTSLDSAIFYGYMIHDLANQHINKKEGKQKHISPPFDQVKYYYITSLKSKGALFWGRMFWRCIHILGATLKSKDAPYFILFLNILVHLLPNSSSQNNLQAFLSQNPVEPYLRNNHDAFLYTYMLHNFINNKRGKRSPPFMEIKTFYFTALGEECLQCRV